MYLGRLSTRTPPKFLVPSDLSINRSPHWHLSRAMSRWQWFVTRDDPLNWRHLKLAAVTLRLAMRVKSGGAVLSDFAIGPPPLPSLLWHAAQYAVYNAGPWIESIKRVVSGVCVC